MAYPPLHRKLFKSDGAGPELKEEIVPHELTKGVTAPSFTLTANDKIWHCSVIDRETDKHWEEFYFSMGDDETKSPRIVFRGAGCDATEYGDNATAGSVSIRANDGTNFNQITLYPNGNTYLSGGGVLSLGGKITANGLVTNAPIYFGDKGARLDVAADGAFVVCNQVTATYPNIWFQSENDGARLFYNQSAYRLQTDHWMAAVGFTATSDARHKRDLKPVRYDLSSITAYHYVLKDDGKPHVGLVAQEVQEVIPDAVSSDKDGVLSLDYNAITAALVEEVKDLKRRCDSLESEKVSLRAAVENLAGQKKSLERICSLLTRGQDILRNENDVAMNEIAELKKRVEKLEAKA